MNDAPFPDHIAKGIREFLTQCEPNPVPVDFIYQEVFDSPFIFPLQRRLELRAMLITASRILPQTVMEIGCDKGGGLFHWAGLPSVVNLIGCEYRGIPYRNQFETVFPELNYCWMEGSSRNRNLLTRLDQFLAQHESSIDVLFIDGEKSKFKEDFDAYLPRMSPGGIVFMHDVGDQPMKGQFQTCCKHPQVVKSRVIESVKEWHDEEERMERGEPITTSHQGWLRHWKGESCRVGVMELK